MIKIFPELTGRELEEVAYWWTKAGAEPFVGEIPKCGYVFEDNASKWKPEQKNDGIWGDVQYVRLPGAKTVTPVKQISSDKPVLAIAPQSKPNVNRFDVSVIRIVCSRCGTEREKHAQSENFKNREYRAAWCAVCEKNTLHSVVRDRKVDVKLPPMASEVESRIKTWMIKIKKLFLR